MYELVNVEPRANISIEIPVYSGITVSLSDLVSLVVNTSQKWLSC